MSGFHVAAVVHAPILNRVRAVRLAAQCELSSGAPPTAVNPVLAVVNPSSVVLREQPPGRRFRHIQCGSLGYGHVVHPHRRGEESVAGCVEMYPDGIPFVLGQINRQQLPIMCAALINQSPQQVVRRVADRDSL